MAETRLQQVRANVTDLRRSLDWYSSVLGFTPTILYPDDRPTYAQFASFEGSDFSIGQGGAIGGRFNFAVDDLDGLWTTIASRDEVEIVEPLFTAPWGTRKFTVRDPDGNELGFLAAPTHEGSQESSETGTAAVTVNRTLGESIDQARLQRAFTIVADAVRAGEMPTAVLGIATSSEVVRCEAFGRDQVPDVGVGSIYMLASISKAITATAVMSLVDDGLLVLSAPMARYVPEFGAAGKDGVTAWHLLTHTSGLVDEGIPWETWRRDGVSSRDILQSVCSAGLDHEPGTGFHYYTGSFYVLAEAISRLTGIPYPKYFRERVFAAAGMTETCFNPWEEEQGHRVIPPLGLTDDGSATAEEVIRYFATLAWPGVGMFGTVHDLLALGQTLLHDRTTGSYRLLSPARDRTHEP